MKGNNKKQVKNKKVFKSVGKNSKRDHLRADNRAYNTYRKLRTKLKRTQTGPPGSPQGKHIPKNENCRCGSCSAL